MSKLIIVAGDIHGDWSQFNTFLNKKRPEIVLQTGDFGFWPKFPGSGVSSIKPKATKIHWCDGNHEDHWSLRDRSSNEIVRNVIYQPRGSLLTLPDGRTVLFCGGAFSIDRDVRIFGKDWFPEEIPSYAEFEIVEKLETKVDIVISHTCPNEFEVERHPRLMRGPYVKKIGDPTRNYLSFVLEKFRPTLWYFGHWHVMMRGFYKETHWRALNMCPEVGWWEELE